MECKQIDCFELQMSFNQLTVSPFFNTLYRFLKPFHNLKNTTRLQERQIQFPVIKVIINLMLLPVTVFSGCTILGIYSNIVCETHNLLLISRNRSLLLISTLIISKPMFSFEFELLGKKHEEKRNGGDRGKIEWKLSEVNTRAVSTEHNELIL